MSNLRVLASDRRQRFFGQILATAKLPTQELVRVIRDASYSPSLRTAALRNLVAQAPLVVTQGRCFVQRRRLVRLHYQA